MSSWIEDEEQKQAIRSQLSAERKRLDQQWRNERMEIEKAMLECLTAFHALCKRVNGVRPGSVLVDRLAAMSCRLDTRSASRTSRTMGHRREIRFTCGEASEAPTPNQAVISAVIVQRERNGEKFWEHDTTIVIRKRCSFQDLLCWQEDQMLSAIKWIILESDSIGSDIPGTEFVTKAEVEAKRRCYVRIRLAKNGGFHGDPVRVAIDGETVGSLPQPSWNYWDAYTSWSQFNLEIGRHEVNVRFGDLSKSVTILVEAGQTVDYEIYQSAWTWNGTIRFRYLGTSPR